MSPYPAPAAKNARRIASTLTIGMPQIAASTARRCSARSRSSGTLNVTMRDPAAAAITLRSLRREVQRLDQERREDRQLAALGVGARVGLPHVVDLEETEDRILPRERQRHLRPQPEHAVLAANENLREPLDPILGELDRREVVEADGKTAVQEVGADAAVDVHRGADLRLAVFLFRLEVEAE